MSLDIIEEQVCSSKKKLTNSERKNAIFLTYFKSKKRQLRAYFFAVFSNCKNILSYIFRIPMLDMLKHNTDENASITLVNGIGFTFGLVGVVAIFIQQSLTMFLPLLIPLVVCVTFCALLINSQQKAKQSQGNISPNPVRIDVI
ncbi:MAG: hypothetical protein ACPH13_05120 [Candidatus Poseidoniaceae archaeon]